MIALDIRRESWPIAGRFTIARGSRSEAEIVLVTLQQDRHVGRGEGTPYKRYGETVDGVIGAIESRRDWIAAHGDREALSSVMPAGAARNAVDAALLDLDCKRQGRRAWELLDLARPKATATCYTISLDEPEIMAEAAARAAHRKILKLKLGRPESDLERVTAVRRAAPQAILVVDANEGWTMGDLQRLAPKLADLDVKLIEQPLPADDDSALSKFASPVPLCADESTQGAHALAELRDRYAYVNIKLDKTGGLTAALVLASEARRTGFGIMLGCMLGTSLAMAPATLLMDLAAYVDLDAPLLLSRDRVPALRYEGDDVLPPDPELWG